MLTGAAALALTGAAPRPEPGAAARAGCAPPRPEEARRTQARDTHHLGGYRVRSLMADLERRSAAVEPPASITVPVRFHVLTDGASGALTRAEVDAQIQTLNDAYGGRRGGADTGVRFVLAAVDATDRADWFRRPDRHQDEFKDRLHGGGPGTLNLYSAAVGQDVLGFSTFPKYQSAAPGRDGVVVDYRSLPGGTYKHFNRGYTAVHEIGHWLGLFHTFENGCATPGDGVADTPYEREPTEGCPDAKDTCPQAGSDPVHNFMDYGWDDCMREFTAGQGVRIRQNWAAYRTPPV